MRLKNNSLLAEHADLGDKRLNKRLAKICNQFSKKIDKSIPESSIKRSDMKATYDFFKKEKVSMDKIISAHLSVHQKNRDKVDKQTLLVTQDSTDLIYSKKRSAQAFGPMNFLYHRGGRLHNSLILSSKGVPIGLFKQSVNIRSDETFGKRNNRKREPIEDKESYKWLVHFNALQEYYAPYPNIEVFSICDREADIHELFCAKQAPNVHLVIRSQHNRTLEEETGKKMPIKLHDKVAESPLRATYKIKVTDRKTCKKRTAQVELRFCPVKFKMKNPTKWQKDLPSVTAWAIQLEEINAPKGKKPVKWILLSTKAVVTIADAKKIIKYYELRWIIERFHYMLKSCAKITDLQLKTPKRILNAIATYSVSVVNLMRINYIAREHPDWTTEQIGIPTIECQVLYKYANATIDKRLNFNPDQPPTVKEFVITIARIGGFTNFSNQNLPGLKTFWRGWNTYQTILKSFFLLCQ